MISLANLEDMPITFDLPANTPARTRPPGLLDDEECVSIEDRIWLPTSLFINLGIFHMILVWLMRHVQVIRKRMLVKHEIIHASQLIFAGHVQHLKVWEVNV